MAVRTFYWDPATKGIRAMLRRTAFRVGNAGDLLNRDLISHFYGEPPLNVDSGGTRLLLVGSVIHRMQQGDLIAGVGTKGTPLPDPKHIGEIDIRGVRGPITHDALAKSGFDVSNITFHADPGLLVKELYPRETTRNAIRNRVAFIPHYRDRKDYRHTTGIRVVDIDCEPRKLAKEVAQAELVLTSSLHGLIFAHAIGRPVVLIAPLQAEPLVKYQDYMASVGLDWTAPVDLESALNAAKPASPADISFTPDTISVPSRGELLARRMITS